MSFLKDRILELLEVKLPSIGASGTIEAKKWHIKNHPGENYCNVCYLELDSPKDFQHFGCGHMFCRECMTDYLEHEISQGANCINMKCPYFSCEFKCTTDLIANLCTLKLVKRYKKLQIDDMLLSSNLLKPCLGKNCTKIFKISKKMYKTRTIYSPESEGGQKVQTTVKELKSFDAFCKCCYNTCLKCDCEAHSPQTCEGSAHWQELMELFGNKGINIDEKLN
jgi:ariadne-1